MAFVSRAIVCYTRAGSAGGFSKPFAQIDSAGEPLSVLDLLPLSNIKSESP
jgi:hypothetical protein